MNATRGGITPFVWLAAGIAIGSSAGVIIGLRRAASPPIRTNMTPLPESPFARLPPRGTDSLKTSTARRICNELLIEAERRGDRGSLHVSQVRVALRALDAGECLRCVPPIVLNGLIARNSDGKHRLRIEWVNFNRETAEAVIMLDVGDGSYSRLRIDCAPKCKDEPFYDEYRLEVVPQTWQEFLRTSTESPDGLPEVRCSVDAPIPFPLYDAVRAYIAIGDRATGLGSFFPITIQAAAQDDGHPNS